MTDINPCPFCGGKVIWVQNDWSNPDAPRISSSRLCYLACVDCKAYGPDLPTREEAIAAWNSRSPAPAATVTGWRLLNIGEVIRATDEWWDSHVFVWRVASELAGQTIDKMFSPVRRRLSQPALEFKPLELSEKDKEFIKTREDFESGIANGWREK